jgi:hypothetical protein
LAISNDGDANDNDETVYVTQFLALPLFGKPDGEDDSKAGLVSLVSTATDSITGAVALQPLADTGFKAAGDAIGRIAPPANPQPADFRFITGAYPNQLQNIAIKGDFAFVPSTGVLRRADADQLSGSGRGGCGSGDGADHQRRRQNLNRRRADRFGRAGALLGQRERAGCGGGRGLES